MLSWTHRTGGEKKNQKGDLWMKLVGVGVEDAADMTKWRQMIYCGNVWREKQKEKKEMLKVCAC